MPHDSSSGKIPAGLFGKEPQQPDDQDVFDLIGVGFGPASLAIAIALYDVLEERAIQGRSCFLPKVKFLEQQATFGWHAGMLLPGTKMQISFIKDLATVRNPRSHFTFLNYLKHHDRLVHFCNLDTFLPLRIEFEDYLKWCAAHFSDEVRYAQCVTSVKPLRTDGSAKVNCFEVTSKDKVNGASSVQIGRKIVIAVGGCPSIPPLFPENHPRILHSSKYNQKIEQIVPEKQRSYSIAVIGAGQSAAEVFVDLQDRYPNARTSMIIRDTALRPSDDSPFVNEVFNPEAVDDFYSNSSETRHAQLLTNKATNYSVVRPALLQEIYHKMYHQRLKEPNTEKWQHQILQKCRITDLYDDESGKTILTFMRNESTNASRPATKMQVDAVVLATGYVRDTHDQLLEGCDFINGSADGNWVVERDYQVLLNRDLVDPGVSIYLQGCNEQTHGLSDTLLSILATRGGEIVESVFGEAITQADAKGALHRESMHTCLLDPLYTRTKNGTVAAGEQAGSLA